MKKRGGNTVSHPHLLLGTAVFGLVVVILIGIGLQLQFNRQLRAEMNVNNIFQFKYMVVTAAEQVTKPLPADPKTGELYVPEASLKFGVPPDDIQLKYSYIQGGNQIIFVDENALHYGKSLIMSQYSLNEVFDKLPEMQACARQARVSLGMPIPEEDLNGLKERYQEVITKEFNTFVYYETACHFQNEKLLKYLASAQKY